MIFTIAEQQLIIKNVKTILEFVRAEVCPFIREFHTFKFNDDPSYKPIMFEISPGKRGALEFTRGLGVEFGSNLNAYTSIDQTVYRVCDVPTKRQSALDSCVLILKDWSNGLTLAGSEIDKERGVIHQEWQLRSSASQRIFERVLPKLYPGSKYGVRLPIGLMSVVDNFKYQELRDYYHKWYRVPPGQPGYHNCR